MKILVTGSNGQLGKEIRNISFLHDLHQFIYTDIGDLDLTDSSGLAAFLRIHQPEVVINCAAYTAVDKAEEEKVQAMEMNAHVPGRLAQFCSESGATLVHISTDYIFDGKNHLPYIETDRANPQSFYGESKYQGELEILKTKAKGIIIRTSWLYSEFGTNFARTIFHKSQELKELKVIDDQIGTPTYGNDLAKVILDILPEIRKQPKMETYHYSNEGVASWYDFAQAILDLSGSTCKLLPIVTSDLKQAATRPPYSVLNKNKMKERFGMEIPYWRHSLEKCLQLLK